MRNGDKTIFLTSHVVQDLENLVDEIIFLRCCGTVYQSSLTDFMANFRRFQVVLGGGNATMLEKDGQGVIYNVEKESTGREGGG